VEPCGSPARKPGTTSPARFTITARPIVQESAANSTAMKAALDCYGSGVRRAEGLGVILAMAED